MWRKEDERKRALLADKTAADHCPLDLHRRTGFRARQPNDGDGMTSLYGSDRQGLGASATPSGSRASMEPSGLHPSGFDPSRKYHHLLGVGEIPCRSCPHDWPYPARYIASAKRIDNLPPTDWPVCEMHSQYAMLAGWFPIRTVDEWRAAIATEARRAETVKQGSVHEGAGPQDIAQPIPPVINTGESE